jgi:hypothetical protein
MEPHPSEIVTSASGVTQRTVRRDDSGRPLGDEREERVIPLEFSVVCKLPRELEQARGKAISALQALDSTRTTELMLEGMNGGGPPIDFAEVRRSEIEAVAEATRRFGWNARNVQQYNGYHLTYRQLQFERFLCELRSVLTESAQEIVSKGCGMLGVEASLVIEGLPTLEDIARAQHELAEGKRSFGDIMESVRGG